jgi:hypothetical protein
VDSDDDDLQSVDWDAVEAEAKESDNEYYEHSHEEPPDDTTTQPSAQNAM